MSRLFAETCIHRLIVLVSSVLGPTTPTALAVGRQRG